MPNVLHLTQQPVQRNSEQPEPQTPPLNLVRLHAANQHESGSAAAGDMSQTLREASLLELLGRRPVIFHRVYVDIAGGVLPAIWLGHALDLARESNEVLPEGDEGYTDPDPVFTLSARDCEEATGLTHSQQVTCVRKLVAAGFVSLLPRQGRVSMYRLHRDAVSQQLLAAAEPLARRLQRQAKRPGSLRASSCQ